MRVARSCCRSPAPLRCGAAGRRSLFRVSRRDRDSAISTACENLFVARTFSKAYGLAGLRIGILAGPRGQMPKVRRVSSPYSVNAVALAVLPVALADGDHIKCYVSQVKNGRERLALELKALGLHSWPSQANFLLIRIGEKHREFVSAMRQRGILVRDRSSDPGCEGCVRITHWKRFADRQAHRRTCVRSHVNSNWTAR